MPVKTQYFEIARDIFGELGVDTAAAIETANRIPISLHCWQGDDVRGFENSGANLDGGIQATGDYPGRARNADELRHDIEKALALIPGQMRVNLHASYLENSGIFVDRNAIEPRHFECWADWAADRGLGLDFNSTFFSHRLSAGGTLTNSDHTVREFWIEHAVRSRIIGEYFGMRTGKGCVTNHWIPDGGKEIPVSTLEPRLRLKDSLDAVFTTATDPRYNKDALESKLFGIGAESYTPGSHEFYLAYTMQNPGILLTIDTGHFHPTEKVSAKISSLLCFKDELLLHFSRPERWDSDHVVLLDDETRQIMRELVRCGGLDRCRIATDYFDASINRVAAWVIGVRNVRKALLFALLEPTDLLKKLEDTGDRTGVLALSQESLTLPFGAVWDYYCETQSIPRHWIDEVKKYENDFQSKRG